MRGLFSLVAVFLAMACQFSPDGPSGGLADGGPGGPPDGKPAMGNDSGNPDADAGPGQCDFLASIGSLPDAARVPEIDTGSYERDPFLGRDGTTIYFSSNRSPAVSTDIWMATRPDTSSPFATPVQMPGINTSMSELRFSMSDNERFGVVSSDRTGSAAVDIWTFSRPQASAPFGQPRQETGASLGSDDHDPFLSGDGLRLYWAGIGRNGSFDILFAERPTTSDTFGVGTSLAQVSTDGGEFDPALANDETLILFVRAGDLYYATRNSRQDMFSSPQPLTGANSPQGDGDPFLSADNCELYFYSNRDGNDDIYVIRLSPTL